VHPSIHARHTPNKLACLVAGSGATVTYRELDDASNRFAHLLRTCGLQAGDHIAILLENNLRLFELCWGGAAFRDCLHRNQQPPHPR